MYMIPKNVKTTYQFFSNFGFRELGITLIGIFVGAAFFFLTRLVGLPIVVSIIGTSIFPATAFLLAIPNPRTSISLLEMIRNFKEYNTKQKRYFYVFGGGRVERD